jgi:hypothetical protein
LQQIPTFPFTHKTLLKGLYWSAPWLLPTVLAGVHIPERLSDGGHRGNDIAYFNGPQHHRSFQELKRLCEAAGQSGVPLTGALMKQLGWS